LSPTPHGDDGELFLEYSEGEALMFDNGRLKTANFNTSQGIRPARGRRRGDGLCAFERNDRAGVAQGADAVSTVKDGYAGTMSAAPQRTNTSLRRRKSDPLPRLRG
jgi:TldD protein